MMLFITIIMLTKKPDGHFMNLTSRQFTMGISGTWGPLNPPQQSTYAASEILSNVFQPLVEYGGRLCLDQN